VFQGSVFLFLCLLFTKPSNLLDFLQVLAFITGINGLLALMQLHLKVLVYILGPFTGCLVIYLKDRHGEAVCIKYLGL